MVIEEVRYQARKTQMAITISVQNSKLEINKTCTIKSL